MKISIEKPNDLYLFVPLKIPADFELDGFTSAEWHPVKDGSKVYYFDSTEAPVALGTTNETSSSVLSRTLAMLLTIP